MGEFLRQFSSSLADPNQSADPNTGDPNQSADPNAGQPNQSGDPNAGGTVTIPEVTVEGDPNAGQSNQSADTAAAVAAPAAAPAVADTASAAVPAVSDVPASAVQAALPAPDPGIAEEIEEGVVSGVRVIARTAPEVAAAAGEVTLLGAATAAFIPVAAAAAVVGIPKIVKWLAEPSDPTPVEEDPGDPDNPKYGHGVGGAPEQTPSNPYAKPEGGGGDAGTDDPQPAPPAGTPPWVGATNPETGKPYTSQEEYDRVQAGIREHRKKAEQNRQPVVDEDPDPDSQRSPRQANTCASLGIALCSEQPPYGFETVDEALRNEPERGKVVGGPSVTTMGDYKDFPEGQNNHYTYHDQNGDKLFTLIKKPVCCTDTPAGPVLTWRWVSAN
jgi:hypothetical protein